jgi:hypothetical protein
LAGAVWHHKQPDNNVKAVQYRKIGLCMREPRQYSIPKLSSRGVHLQHLGAGVELRWSVQLKKAKKKRKLV